MTGPPRPAAGAAADQTVLLQGTCILVGAGAVLIRGEPGSGKSALAAALLSRAAPHRLVRLVGDDAVRVRSFGRRLVAFAPDRMRGLIEMRGLGLVAVGHEPRAVVRLVVDLVDGARVARLPETAALETVLCGAALSRLALPAGDSASADRVLAAVERVIRTGSLSATEPGAGGADPRIRA